MISKDFKKNILKLVVLNALLVGCSSSEISKESTITTSDQEIVLVDEKQEKIFAPGEHTILIVDSIHNHTQEQMPLIVGYEYNKDLTIREFSNRRNIIAYTYTNQVEVKVIGTKDGYGNIEYNSFGTPTEKGKEQLEQEKQASEIQEEKTKKLQLNRH